MDLSKMMGGNLLLVRSEMIFTTQTIAVPDDGWAVVAGMGGGAGGGKNLIAGNSAPWGVKIFAVAAGQAIGFTIGAGGAPVGYDTRANAGGDTFISYAGATIMTCRGGDAGPASTTAKAPVVATVTGADLWRAGRQPMSSQPAGGAAVDVGNFTFSEALSAGDHAVDVIGGGSGVPVGYYFWPFDITFSGISPGMPGVGAAAGSGKPSGFFAGGSGWSDSGLQSLPGRGASAGVSGGNTPRYGGAGLAHVRLFKRAN
ncbi:hypothetical protein [Delftia sp. WSY_22]|uniref:hypothetical protein n=1 Tax=Delftia sp. WSY_22 TaxID=3367213 RepID=UPI00370A7D5D